MGRSIADSNGGGGDFAPTAMLKEEGATLKGILVGKRDAKTKFGPRPVFSLKVLDASCRFTVGGNEVQPNEGDTVEAFAPTRLARQLSQVKEGETVTITYKGTKKVGQGNPAHFFDVMVD